MWRVRLIVIMIYQPIYTWNTNTGIRMEKYIEMEIIQPLLDFEIFLT